MSEILPVKACLIASLMRADAHIEPFRHWLLQDVLPEGMVDELCALPLSPPAVSNTFGRRETHNSTRLFFGSNQQECFPVTARLAQVLQDSSFAGFLQTITSAKLKESFLRIEYCLDTNGFWLEPHTDIGAKFFTMLVYLNDPPEGEEWGTDIYDTAARKLMPAPGGRNHGLIFVPGHDTWHGFEKRPITGIRRTLIVNYVTTDWQARHQLAFPNAPVL